MADKTGHITILILCMAVIIISALIDVDEGLALIPIKGGVHSPRLCLFHSVFGLDCPFCGLTRGFSMIAHGNLSGAIKFNNVSIAVFIFFVSQIFYRLYVLIKGTDTGARSIYLNMPWVIIVAALLVNWTHYLLNNI